ncbi:MAG: hypothetical protein JNG85_03620 [Spirochaetaceae bacterium]|nr:hypothetical protein [Spirochaetaceae bacterium]
MKRARRIAFLLLGFAAAVGMASYLVLGLSLSRQRARIAALESLEARLVAERVPLRFMILSRGPDEVSARIKLYDLDGREVAAVERSFEGRELYFDFAVAPLASALPRASSAPARLGRGGVGLPAEGVAERLAGTWLAFPRRVFTERSPARSGFDLAALGERDGYPAAFAAAGLAAAEREAIASVYAAALAALAVPDPAGDQAGPPEAGAPASRAFGSAVHEMAALAGLEPGIVYKIVCRAKGGIEIMED